MRGGSRPGAGRPKGAISKSTFALLESAAAGGETPVQYMLRVMRDENAPNFRRDEMAKLAAPYLHPKLTWVGDDVEEEPVVAETPEVAPIAQAAE